MPASAHFSGRIGSRIAFDCMSSADLAWTPKTRVFGGSRGDLLKRDFAGKFA